MCVQISRTLQRSNDISPFAALGALLRSLRERAGLATQSDLATLLGARQQTVSRWEKGLSRPRTHDIPRIAVALKADADEIYAAAGYITDPGGAASFDKPFPVHGLTPDSFERFCAFMLERLYRPMRGRVQRAGGSGHTQDGIDITVDSNAGVHTFQCKRVNEFGPKKVVEVVAKQTVPAERKFLLLSCLASPQARAAMAAHTTWELWDREDISVKVRSLPRVEQRELVDIFFRNQRQELLGDNEPGPWETIEQFFAPFLEDGRVFNHRWDLVGREEEVDSIAAALADTSVLLTMLVGMAGGGKTRLLKHALDGFKRQFPHVAVHVLASTSELTQKSLEDLGTGEKLLVVDDAHDRDDLGVLLRYCAVSTNRARLLFSMRPYCRDSVIYQAATFALNGAHVKEIPLKRQTPDDAERLAAQVLAASNGPEDAAKQVAAATYGSPLATVIGAQIVAKNLTHPVWLGNDAEFQRQILSRYQDVITGDIVSGLDVSRIQGVLRVVALVQPVLPEDPGLLQLLNDVESIELADANRLLRVLVDAGILFRRGVRYRLSPDLLADSIIERYCIGPARRSSGYAERVFDVSPPSYLSHILVNMGKLDWRQRDGDTRDSELLDGLWRKLRWQDKYQNPHIEAAAEVAYYQPRRALEFAKQLVHDGHGADSNVCSMIKDVAYNYDFVEDACALLWEAGHLDLRPLNQHPDHAIRILKELAEFEPSKPPEYISKVVDFAVELLDFPEFFAEGYTPFEILEGALAAEGHITTAATSRTVTWTAFSVSRSAMNDIRAHIIATLFRCLVGANNRTAFLAAQCIQHALRRPMGMMGLHVPPQELGEWDAEHAQTLRDLLSLLETGQVSPVVLVRVAESVAWHAYFGPMEQRDVALRIIEMLGRDLRARLIRVLMDGWGCNTWPIDDDTAERSAHQKEVSQLSNELQQQYSSAGRLTQCLEDCLSEIEGLVGTPCASHIFVNQLISANLGLAQRIVELQLGDYRGPLHSYGGAALGALLANETVESRDRVRELLLRPSDRALELVAEAYVRATPRQGYTSFDVEVLRAVFASKEPSVLRMAAHLVRQVASQDAQLAVELLSSVDMVAAGCASQDFFMWVGRKDNIPWEAIRDDQLRTLVANVRPLVELDDHWVRRFLEGALKRVPDAVISLVVARMEDAISSKDWRLTPLLRGHARGDGLGLLQVEGPTRYIEALLEWGLAHVDEASDMYCFGQTFAGLCGEYDAALMEVLLAWMSHRTLAHVRVVASILREAQRELVYRHGEYVSRLLREGKAIGTEAHRALLSAIYAATMSGVRSTVPGEPYAEDLKLETHSVDMLSRLSRMDPAYSLYSDLLDMARDGIARQQRQKEAMDAEDEERR